MRIDELNTDATDLALFERMIKDGMDIAAAKAAGYQVIGTGTMSVVFMRPEEDHVVKVNLMPDRCWNMFLSEFVADRGGDPHLPAVYKHSVDRTNRGFAYMEHLTALTDKKFIDGFYSFVIKAKIANLIVRMSRTNSPELAAQFESEHESFCKTVLDLHSYSNRVGCKLDMMYSGNIMMRGDVPVIVDLLM